VINEVETTSAIEIRKVNNSLEIENFIRFHELLYDDDKLYVLPIRKEFHKSLVNQLIKGKYKEPVIAYNAYLNGRISGRIWLTVFTARTGNPQGKKEGRF